jgi:hypothetical protein
MPTGQAQQVQPGSMFGVPGITQRFEQYDTTVAAVNNLGQTAQVPWNNVFPLQKTDVINWWELNVTWTNTITAGTAVIALSPYAPYNLLQNFNLQMQGQFKPLDVISGFDAALFQLIRPMRGSAQMAYQPLLGSNPATPYANAGIPQANLVALPSMTTGSASIPFTLEIPGSIWLDQYWDLAEDGTVLAPPIAAYVSPQYMGGGERIVTPRLSFAAGIAGTYDQGPIVETTAGTITTFTSSVSIDVRRVGVYASTNPQEMPPVFNWQYQRRSRQLPIGASPKVDLPITDYGQILMLFVRLFDPSLGTNGVGGAVSIANVSKCQLLYGSNLPKYDDTPLTAQKRFLDQHGFLPPVGTVIWDMALTDTGGYLTNSKALNTLTNANCKVHLEFSVTPGASTYGVMGVESLVFVSNQ